MKRIRFIILFTIICIQTQLGQAQRYSYQEFNHSDLLTAEYIYDLCQDDNLLYYLGTDKGILVYNGSSFSIINQFGTLSLKDGVENIAFHNNAIYFTSRKSLYKFSQTDSSVVSLMSNITLKGLQIVDKSIYAFNNTTLFKIQETPSIVVDTIFHQNGIQINDWTLSGDKFYIGSNVGLFEEKHDHKEFARTASYLNISSMLENPDSTIQVLGNLDNSNFGLFKYSQDKIIKVKDLNIAAPQHIYLSNKGNTWIIDSKANIYINNRFSIIDFRSNNPYANFKVTKVKEDKEGNLWVLGKSSALLIDVSGAFIQKKMGEIIAAGAANDEMMFITKDEIIIENPVTEDKKIKVSKNTLISGDINPFFYDGNWFINSTNGLIRVNGQQLELFKVDKIIKQYTRIGNQLYGINNEGIYTLDRYFKVEKKLLDYSNIQEVRFKKGQIYVLDRSKKVSVITAEKTHVFQFLEKEDIDLENYTFYRDELWSFTGGSIIKRNAENKEYRLALDKKLNRTNYSIRNLFFDKKENLWVSFNDEIIRIALNTSNDGNSFSIQGVDYYGGENNIYANYFNEVIENEEGELFFIHDENITVFNPLLENPSLIPPGIYLEEAFAISYDEYNYPLDTIDLRQAYGEPLDQKSVVFLKANVITTNRKADAKIGYRINDLNQDWINVSSGQLITIFDLPSGKNSMELRSINADGIESIKTINLTVTIKEPYWKTYWFYLSLSGLFLIVGFVTYRSLNNYKDNKTKELHEKLDKELNDLEKRSHLQILKAERLKQLNELITSQKSELEKKNSQIESQKYELSITNGQIKQQKDLLEDTSSKLKASINYAQRIQNALMSTEIELKEAIDESFVYFQPRDVVSGDFFWFNTVTNDAGEELYVVAAVDCTGHGVPGAIVSVVGINLLNNITNLKKIYDPGEILFELNKDIIHNLRQNETQVNDGMDMSLVTINTKTREIKFAGAKNPLMYVENGELIRIRGDKFAIGGQQRELNRNYTTHTISPSEQPKMFYLFSDGYQDQFGGEKGFKFLTSNFKSLLVEIHEKTVIDQKDILYNRINKWKGDYSQTDDMLVIGIRL